MIYKQAEVLGYDKKQLEVAVIQGQKDNKEILCPAEILGFSICYYVVPIISV